MDLTTTTGEATKEDKLIINLLFKKLTAIYPAWKQAFEGDEQVKEAKRVWLEALIDNGINQPEQIKTGLKQAMKSESPFLPSVGQFMKWCKTESVPAFKPFPEIKYDDRKKSTPEFVENLLKEHGWK